MYDLVALDQFADLGSAVDLYHLVASDDFDIFDQGSLTSLELARVTH